MKRPSAVSCLVAGLLVVLAGVLVLVEWGSDRTEPGPRDAVSSPTDGFPAGSGDAPAASKGDGGGAEESSAPVFGESATEASEEPRTEEEKRAAEEDALVDSFDALTDKWMEPAEKGVKMSDVDAFVAQFKKVPQGRRDECLQRALNLIPDENVMLLAGVLMDKSQPKELVELVFNDILNRDEGVKNPILQQIFKDKTHSCWADTAWILDVTGEAPKGSMP